MNKDGCTSSIKDKILTVEVKAGWKEGTKIIFPKEGDQVNYLPMRLQFSAVRFIYISHLIKNVIRLFCKMCLFYFDTSELKALRLSRCHIWIK